MKKEPICVSSEADHRKLIRRKDDLTLRQKAAKFDQLMLDAKFQFEHWSKLFHAVSDDPRTGSVGYYQGQAHAYFFILAFYTGANIECPCPACTHERMSAAEACEKTGSEKEKL